MSEELIVRHCSPTLAGLKTGSLFSCPSASPDEMRNSLRDLNIRLAPKGIRVLPVKNDGERMLIYIYRPGRLARDLGDGEAAQILCEKGYPCGCPGKCIMKLIERLRGNEFPHEIGLFLGYPPEDVKGFMTDPCACKCSGCWKVYGDREAAEKRFALYRKCTGVYCGQWRKGRPIERLAVPG